MSKYIDADKLKKLIDEKWKELADKGVKVGGGKYEIEIYTYLSVLRLIDSLQQEQSRKFIEINGIKYKEVPAKTNDKICKDCDYFLDNGSCDLFDDCPCICEDTILEKIQQEQTEEDLFERPETPIKDAIEVTSRMQYIDDDLRPIAEFILDYASWNLHKDEWNHPVLEVPLFRVLDALAQRGKPYCCVD